MIPGRRSAERGRCSRWQPWHNVSGSRAAQALKVHQEVNCLTDVLGECEEQRQALKKVKKRERGLLCGVPTSLKATYDCV
ncbi:vitamin D3 hydroxylase-associated protein-like [Globicephala melas]|uniref:vitamin D3 hydroxylase-associated protein-like n=1 Tax=Globicephala melas TaxID=9731 RepID=UPI00293D295E|nr:vitamin D3 hydroxylase-associated protein-like [Globicephala melas]